MNKSSPKYVYFSSLKNLPKAKFRQIRPICHTYVDSPRNQCCQMAYFQTRNPNLVKFWKVLQWTMYQGVLNGHFVYFMAKWNILRPFGIFLPFWYVVQRQILQP
jgi:hypothetical protein